jgi:hypothetical protein
MAWQAYVDQNLLASGMVTSAGIYDLAGNPWAYSAGFAAQIAEVASVSGHMAAEPTALAATGVRGALTNHCTFRRGGGGGCVRADAVVRGAQVVVAGVKYMFVQGTQDEVYVKKGNTGVVFCKCKPAASAAAPALVSMTRDAPPREAVPSAAMAARHPHRAVTRTHAPASVLFCPRFPPPQ